MLGFPIAQIDVFLLGKRNPFLREGRQLSFTKAGDRLMRLRGRAYICSTFHGPVYTLFLLACPVLFYRENAPHVVTRHRTVGYGAPVNAVLNVSFVAARLTHPTSIFILGGGQSNSVAMTVF